MVIDPLKNLLANFCLDQNCTYVASLTQLHDSTLLSIFRCFFVQYGSKSCSASHIISIFFRRLKRICLFQRIVGAYFSGKLQATHHRLSQDSVATGWDTIEHTERSVHYDSSQEKERRPPNGVHLSHLLLRDESRRLLLHCCT